MAARLVEVDLVRRGGGVTRPCRGGVGCGAVVATGTVGDGGGNRGVIVHDEVSPDCCGVASAVSYHV